MVYASAQADSEEKRREVYKWSQAHVPFKDKCTAIDAYDQIVVLGLSEKKGFICPLIKDSTSGQQIEYEINVEEYETKSRQGQKVDLIKYLARLDYFAILTKNELTIIKQQDLSHIQTYSKNKKITNFCINEEVYRSAGTGNRNVSQTDQICICANNTLFFLEAEFVAGFYKFTEDQHSERKKGFSIGSAPEQLLWHGDKIYLAQKRSQRLPGGFLQGGLIHGNANEVGAYIILNYNNG